jgi:cytochrome c5
MIIGRQAIFAMLCLSVATSLSAQAGNSNNAAAIPSQAKAKNVAVHSSLPDGQKIFEQNCSRCHNAPMGFSPRISGTVVRHMRVRAGLSEQDAQALMRFFNP